MPMAWRAGTAVNPKSHRFQKFILLDITEFFARNISIGRAMRDWQTDFSGAFFTKLYMVTAISRSIYIQRPKGFR